jgi:hypothetical protein
MNVLLRCLALSGVVAAVAAGCADEKKTQTADADAGAEQSKKPVLDSKLEAAVKAAESAQASSKSKGGDGPPENGVFGPGFGDKAHPPGAPAKVELIGEGAEPRVMLAPAPADEQKETVNTTVRLQGSPLPVEYGLALKIDKPKDEKKTDGPKVWRVVGKVASLSVSPQLPRDASDKLGKLKGTEIRYTIGPTGGATDLGYTLAKDADPGLGEAVVKSLVDSIGFAVPPLPQKPVGVGATWMVTDRGSTFGVEVVRYRVYKIERISDGVPFLSLDVRQYAAKDEAELGQKMTVKQFESQGKGRMEWSAASLLPPRGEVSQRTAVAGSVAGGQQGVFQGEVTAKFTAEAGEKKK